MNSLGERIPRIGTAAWSIPRDIAESFPGEGSHLSRYSKILSCAEINSSFYRPHRSSTYARWAASTPDDFKFSAKLPKAISHECALVAQKSDVQTFLGEISHLGEKLGPILIQLPPRQAFEQPVAEAFLSLLRDLHPLGYFALEPRNAGWFSDEADKLLRQFRVSRVVADPSPAHTAAAPGGFADLIYYRLHGSPRTYYSSYSEERLKELGNTLANSAADAECWCVFDNTASGAAAHNAVTLSRILTEPSQ